MIYKLAPITWVLKVSRDIDLWHLQAQLLKSSLSLCPPHYSLRVQQPFSHKVGYLKWKHIQNPQTQAKQEAKLLLRLHSNARCLKTSTSCWSAGLRQFMSNIRNTLTELISKIASIKPNASQANKEIETSFEVKSKAKETINAPTVYRSPPNATVATPTPTSTSSNLVQATETAASGCGEKLRRTGSVVKENGTTRGLEDTKPASSNGSETIPAATHSQGEKEQTADPVSKTDTLTSEPATTSAPSSPKKGTGHSAQSDQNFISSYIAPLIPKFRATESGSTGEKKPEEKPAAEATVAEEQKTTEEKGKRVVQQREKKLDRASLDTQTRRLVHLLHRASGESVHINTVEDLNSHLMEFPETCGVAVDENVIACLLHLRQDSDPDLRAAIRQALSLVGYNGPVKGQGIRILTIDGGGLRGLVAFQTLHRLESLTGKPIYELFDYICGVSTGALIGFMLGINQLSLDECIARYRKLAPYVFQQNPIIGRLKMGWSHAFYSTENWEKTLKEQMGRDRIMVETSRNPKCPKVAAVSTIVNQGTPVKAYVFRNYNFPPGVHSSYRGGCQHQLWQAIRASTAAPGYFEELTLGGDKHGDGGLLTNNPTYLAIDECKSLWPNTPVECVVSVGTGHFTTPGKQGASVSLKTVMDNFISAATDTEPVHTMLKGLLPPDTYFRFNPYMSEEIGMDEIRPEKMDLLEAECLRYLDRNEEEMKRAAHILTREKGFVQRLVEWARLKGHMFDRRQPPSSKL